VPAMPTMSFGMQLVRPGERKAEHRHTSSTVYCVVEGCGTTVADDVRMDWEPNDVFVVPGWTWHHHENRGTGDAVIYSVSDAAAMRKLGLYREEGCLPTGEVVEIVH
jgi:gentisate 1,2-dioxygenase